jgi:hypothetical protein
MLAARASPPCATAQPRLAAAHEEEPHGKQDHAKPCRLAWPQPSCAAMPSWHTTKPDLNGASVISSPFIGVELTSWKARTLPRVTAVFWHLRPSRRNATSGLLHRTKSLTR